MCVYVLYESYNYSTREGVLCSLYATIAAAAAKVERNKTRKKKRGKSIRRREIV